MAKPQKCTMFVVLLTDSYGIGLAISLEWMIYDLTAS